MSRGRGERNWDDHLPHTEVEVPSHKIRPYKSRKKYFHLEVEQIHAAPLQCIVRDEDDNEWMVIQGADGALTIEERPDITAVASDKNVLAAVKRRWPT